MSSKTLADGRQTCWLIEVSRNAKEMAGLIDRLKEDKKTFQKVAVVSAYKEKWEKGGLSDHDFMHRTKAIIEKSLGGVAVLRAAAA